MKFNEALLKINHAVLKKYPDAQFYEAQGFLLPKNGKNVDGTIDTAQFLVAYNYVDASRQNTIIGTFNLGMFEYDANYIFMPLEAAQKYFGLKRTGRGP